MRGGWLSVRLLYLLNHRTAPRGAGTNRYGCRTPAETTTFPSSIHLNLFLEIILVKTTQIE
jgi:hypothetical protein